MDIPYNRAMKIVSRNAANASATYFVPPPADSDPDRIGDFAYFSSGAGTPEYVRALNLEAHKWLLQRAPYGSVWVHGRVRLSGWIHYRRQIIFLTRSAGLIISRSDLALPPERPQLKLV